MTTNLTIAPGVTLRVLPTDKFKAGYIGINFIRQHDRENAPLDALLPSVLFSAMEKYPDIRSISRYLDELYGASFGNATRRRGEAKIINFSTNFIEDCFLPEKEGIFHSIVEFLGEAVFHPYTENGCFAASVVERQKQEILNSIDAKLNNKQSYAVEQMFKIMCADENFGVPPLGYREDVEKITPQMLWQHYQEVLRTSRIEIFYAGRQPAETVAAEFAPMFRREEQQWAAAETQNIREVKQVREVSEAMDVTQGKLIMGLRTGITCEDEDYAALFLLNTVLGGSVTSKLFVNVREKMSLCYYAQSAINNLKGIMLISAGIAFKDYEVAKNAILHELEECKKGNITEKELENARRQVRSVLKMAMDIPADLEDYYVTMALAAYEDIPEFAEHISRLTVADLAAAAKKIQLDTIYFLKGEEK